MEIKLNKKQQEAVEAVNGPLLILAGAGSGKTRTIVTRIAHIINEKLAKPYQILALTFTNKAAKEMRDRLASYELDSLDEMWAGTFHSVCAKMLRIHAEDAGLKRNFTIYDSVDSKAIVRQIAKALNLDLDSTAISRLMGLISDFKAKMPNLEARIDSLEDELGIDFHDVCLRYNLALSESNAADFDDLLLFTADMLSKSEKVLQAYQRRFRYILVDEYQDTNRLQYEIVALLAREHKNICVCGDEDQSIYSWRGADIRNILEFEQDFPSAKVIKLEENYRSTKAILEAANTLISHNESRIGKTLFTNCEESGFVRVYGASNETEEALFVASQILECRKEGEGLSDVAVLFRVNALSRRFEQIFSDRGIPYNFIGSTRFYERAEIKDVLSYLRLAENPLDSLSFQRAVASPRRGLGPAAIEALFEFAAFKGIDAVAAASSATSIPALRTAQKSAFAKFGSLVSQIADCSRASDAVKLAIDESGYREYVKTGKAENAESRLRNLDELYVAVQEFERVHADDPSIRAFLEASALVSPTDDLSSTDGAVNMMTIHSAKGLEYATVFVCGMEKDLFPSRRANLEEERRLCYVAMTRAKQNLFLTYAHERMLYNTKREADEISPFLREICPQTKNAKEKASFEPFLADRKEALAEQQEEYRMRVAAPREQTQNGFAIGDKIRHPQFGEGLIVETKVSVSGQLLTVAFVGAGIKKIAPLASLIEKL
ncbi:MAG: UvrD-helicase domain-containing protein [Eubacteriaceae bacterium]|nr:UvrD-helicase domain-containing protein [Eubacteriaceae bacterium]